jgi:predicted transposase/invertase (TIGR01784 family)
VCSSDLIGIQKGRQEGALAIARNLLKSNVDVNIISASTGLSIEEIQSLQNSLEFAQ